MLQWLRTARANIFTFGGRLLRKQATSSLTTPLTSRVRSARFRPIYRYLIFVWVASFVVLGICGAHKPEGVYVVLSRLATLYYFAHFLVILPVLGKLERPLPLPESITQAVTGLPLGLPLGRPLESH